MCFLSSTEDGAQLVRACDTFATSVRSGSSVLRVSVSVRVVHVIDVALAIFLFCSVRWYFQLVSSSERGKFTIRSLRAHAWLMRTRSAVVQLELCGRFDFPA